jgi:hypothetical protein
MSTVNWKRVIVGGLVAGLVMNLSQIVLNVFAFSSESEAAMTRMNLEPAGGGAALIFLVDTFLIGVLIVWLYASVSPRYGAGPRTALLIGIVIAFLVRIIPSINFGAFGMFPVSLLMIAGAWGLIEVLIAALLGCRFYKEA